MKRKLCVTIVLTLILALVIPDVLPSKLNKAAAATGIDVTNVVLKPGKTKKVTIEGLGTGFTWTSSNTSVAKITKKVKADNTATITAKGEGVAVITATKGSNTYTCSVVVLDKVETTDTSGNKTTKSKSIKDITVFEKNGTVSVVRSKKTLNAAKDMKLKNDDYSIIGKDSFLRLCLDDDSYAYFESGTEFAVSKAWFSKIKICMTKGEMILEVQKKLDKEDSVDVITPNASMSIRGTVVALKTIPGDDGKMTTISYVLEGTAEVTYKDKKTKKNKVVTLKAGEGWETTTNKKGKAVSNKKADASKFDFENIDLSKLKGADGNEIVVIGKDIDKDAGNGSDNGKDTDTGKDTDNGTDSGSDKGQDTNTGNDKNTDSNSDSGNDSNTGSNEDNSDQTSGEDSFEKAIPAAFDYDPNSYDVMESKEDRLGETTFVIKEYDFLGVIRHKSQTVETWYDNNQPEENGKNGNNIYYGTESFTNTDWYYDSNSVLRVYTTNRTEYSPDSASGNGKEKIYTTETRYNASKTKIYENSVDDMYDTTTWYDDQGRIAEYIRLTITDNKIVEHLIYSYNKNGDQMVSAAND